jgi:hypothetical protein
MSEYKTVGDYKGQIGNYAEPGIETESIALYLAAPRSDQNRPLGIPFTTPSPKIYPHMDADANPVSHEDTEARAIGKPFVQKFGED